MEKISLEMPWRCNVIGICEGEWHLGSFVMTVEALFYDSPHTSWSISTSAHRSSIPSYEEFEAAWREYRTYVAESGDDPLGDFGGGNKINPEEIKQAARLQLARS